MADLERAILIAARAHYGQRDKSGAPYILHPLRVMQRMPTEMLRVIAVLHDVIEDTVFSLENLRDEGFSNDILEALDCLTRREGETYERFIERVKSHPLAVQVKIADLEDNMDMRRMEKVTEKDLTRIAKYHRAWMEIKGC
ncbi:hypothetical protein [Desulforhabdus amnigena]|jgi:(p)ppGpp synthase/HD superfamily hydrolase|uniref:GTP pyrophosphokinase n=1 Tax=Desulforhabdus amnigena TaxID=40218 RepID=A0A9W6FWQ6_9BACT|nr:hypothetical protein [Desulforhabdus amnigena]NLJ28545.1 GTP pyrophosphokinase [Deltaproteobacteria bacterium]GLI36296.1 hypothetical protein DAMNIGENAA_37290 [Desulforhabdus amnigena]